MSKIYDITKFVSVNEQRQMHPAEHEIWLSFADDTGAEVFNDWLTLEGWDLFVKWGKANEWHGEYMRDEFPE